MIPKPLDQGPKFSVGEKNRSASIIILEFSWLGYNPSGEGENGISRLYCILWEYKVKGILFMGKENKA